MTTARELALSLIADNPSTAMLVALDVVRIIADERMRRRERPQKPRQADRSKIVAAVCGYYCVTETDLCGRMRHRNVSEARHMAWWLLHVHLRLSYESIGEWAKRDHSSVMNGVQRAQRFRVEFDELSRQLGLAQAEAAE